MNPTYTHDVWPLPMGKIQPRTFFWFSPSLSLSFSGNQHIIFFSSDSFPSSFFVVCMSVFAFVRNEEKDRILGNYYFTAISIDAHLVEIRLEWDSMCWPDLSLSSITNIHNTICTKGKKIAISFEFREIRVCMCDVTGKYGLNSSFFRVVCIEWNVCNGKKPFKPNVYVHVKCDHAK